MGKQEVPWQGLPISASTEDFNPSSGTAVFEEGQRTAFIDLNIVDDSKPEPMEVRREGRERASEKMLTILLFSPFLFFYFKTCTYMYARTIVQQIS